MHNTRQHEDNSSSPPLTLPPLSLCLSLSPSGSASLHLSISLSPPLSLSASLGAAPPPMAASSASGAGGASSASLLRGFPADGTPANSPQHSRGAREEGSERGGDEESWRGITGSPRLDRRIVTGARTNARIVRDQQTKDRACIYIYICVCVCIYMCIYIHGAGL